LVAESSDSGTGRRQRAPLEKVGIDLGLKEIAVTSDDTRCEKSRFYRGIEQKIAQAQRRGTQDRRNSYIEERRTGARMRCISSADSS